MSPPERGADQTCNGFDVLSAGGDGVGEGKGVLVLERHQGVFAGNEGIIGKSVSPPFGIFVMADVNCFREFKYHSW